MSDAPSEVPLELEGVHRHFGDFTAVQDISLRVEPGEIFALLGPNGAGKTTLIGCITGLGRQSSGAIRIFGHDNLQHFREARRLVGVVPQEINFDPFFTPHESLMIQMGYMGVEPDANRADELLRTLSLHEQRDAYSRHLSGGMKRRLLIAKALVHRPRLLFLDEPTAGVDVELRNDLWREVRRLRDQGTTIILTTHYLEEAEELADRIGVMRRGELVAVESKDTLMRRFQERELVLRAREPITSIPDGLPDNARLEAGSLVVGWREPADLEAALSAARQSLSIVDLETRSTRLEDVFLRLIADPEATREPSEGAA